MGPPSKNSHIEAGVLIETFFKSHHVAGELGLRDPLREKSHVGERRLTGHEIGTKKRHTNCKDQYDLFHRPSVEKNGCDYKLSQDIEQI